MNIQSTYTPKGYDGNNFNEWIRSILFDPRPINDSGIHPDFDERRRYAPTEDEGIE